MVNKYCVVALPFALNNWTHALPVQATANFIRHQSDMSVPTLQHSWGQMSQGSAWLSLCNVSSPVCRRVQTETYSNIWGYLTTAVNLQRAVGWRCRRWSCVVFLWLHSDNDIGVEQSGRCSYSAPCCTVRCPAGPSGCPTVCWHWPAVEPPRHPSGSCWPRWTRLYCSARRADSDTPGHWFHTCPKHSEQQSYCRCEYIHPQNREKCQQRANKKKFLRSYSKRLNPPKKHFVSHNLNRNAKTWKSLLLTNLTPT